MVGFIIKIYHDARSPERQICLKESSQMLTYQCVRAVLYVGWASV